MNDIEEDNKLNNKCDELFDLQLKLEDVLELFHQSTDYVLTYSEIAKSGNEIDLTNSNYNQERKQYENISDDKVNQFEDNIEFYANKITNLFNDIDHFLVNLPNKEEYLKTEEELKNELKELKFKQQHKIESITKVIEIAKDTLKNLEQGQQNLDMFHGIS